MTTEVTPDGIMQLGFACWGSKTFLSAVELGLWRVLGTFVASRTETTDAHAPSSPNGQVSPRGRTPAWHRRAGRGL